MYSLPKNSKLEAVSALHSTVDVLQLQQTMAKSIASIVGVPFEIIGGGYSNKDGGKKSLENSRVFSTNMNTLCSHLQNLLSDVYEASFPKSKISLQFQLTSSPRIEVNNIAVSFVIDPDLHALYVCLVYYSMTVNVYVHRDLSGFDATCREWSTDDTKRIYNEQHDTRTRLQTRWGASE